MYCSTPWLGTIAEDFEEYPADRLMQVGVGFGQSQDVFQRHAWPYQPVSSLHVQFLAR